MSASEVFANQPFGTVTSGGTTPDTGSETWTVAQNPAAPFPAAATGVSQFHVTDTDTTAASEIILVTSISGTTWTVTRGAEGTTPVAHQPEFTITQVLTAGWLSGVVSGVNAVDNGGTGLATAAAYALLAGGTAPTSPLQQVGSLGTSGQVLTSQGAGSLPAWTSQTGLVNPMTALGDMISGAAGGTATRLVGNTTAAKQYLTQTGTGSASQAPQWGTIASADVPVLNQNTTGTASNVTGIVAVLNGGTGGTAATAYAVLTGGTTATAPHQVVSGTGTAGQALTSNGAGSLPSWQQTFTGLMEPLAAPVTSAGSPYSAAAGQYVPVDTTGGNVTVNLPSGAADKAIVGIKHVIQGGTNAVTWVATGGAAINKTGGGTQGTLPLASQGIITQYAAAGTIWYVYSDDLPLGQLDLRYVTQSSLPLGAGLGGTGMGSLSTFAIVAGGTASTTPVQQIAAGTSGQVLTGNGAGTLPSFQANVGFNSPMTALGDLIYGGSSPTAGAAARLAGGTTTAKTFLTQTGTGSVSAAPAWGTIASTDVPTLNQNTTGTAGNVSGTVATGNGGTGLGSLTAYALVAGGTAGTTPVQQVASLGSSGNVLTSNGAGTLPTWQANIGFNNPMTVHGDIIFENAALAPAALPGNTTSTKNILTSTGSGGTANSPIWGTITAADVPTLNQNTTGTAANVTGTVATINGGTGLASLTTYAVITGGTSATAPHQQVSGVGTSGQVLTSAGAAALPAWQALPAAGASTGGTITLAGDLAGTPSSPQVTSTHLAAALPVTQGGIGGTQATAYAVVTGGTTSTAALQQVSGLGTAGQPLVSQGAAALPQWAPVSGQFLSTFRFAPTTATFFPVNSTTPAAFGPGTIGTQPFTAPPSGNVLITVNCVLVTTGGGVFVAMFLSPHGSATTVSSDIIQYESPSAGFAPQQGFPFMLSGLTPGTSYNFDLLGSATSAQAGTIIAFTQTTSPPLLGVTDRGGPVVVTVQAV